MAIEAPNPTPLGTWQFAGNLASLEETMHKSLTSIKGHSKIPTAPPFVIEIILREALTNCVTHACPPNAAESFQGQLTASTKDSFLILEISHNGGAFRISEHPRILSCTGHTRTSGRGWWILRHYIPRVYLSGDGRHLRFQLTPTNPATDPIMSLLQATRQEDFVVLRFPQSLTALNGPDFRKELKEVLAEGPIKQAVADFEQVMVIDSHGIGVLSALYNSLKKKGGSLRVINTSAEIAYLLKSMRLDHYFPIELRSETPGNSGSQAEEDHESL